MLRDWSSDIVSFVAHCSIFAMYSVLIIGFLLWFVVFFPKGMYKSLEIFFSGNIRCFTKESSMFLLSWCALCIAFWNYKVSWFLIAYFNLSLLLTFQMKNFFCLKTFGTSLQKQQYCSFHGTPCIYHFRCRKCLGSCLLIFIWH